MAWVIRQDEIVSNMFPMAIRDRLYYANKEGANGANGGPEGLDIDGDIDSPEIFSGAPLAELYTLT
jgi:hypothetical protein